MPHNRSRRAQGWTCRAAAPGSARAWPVLDRLLRRRHARDAPRAAGAPALARGTVGGAPAGEGARRRASEAIYRRRSHAATLDRIGRSEAPRVVRRTEAFLERTGQSDPGEGQIEFGPYDLAHAGGKRGRGAENPCRDRKLSPLRVHLYAEAPPIRIKPRRPEELALLTKPWPGTPPGKEGPPSMWPWRDQRRLFPRMAVARLQFRPRNCWRWSSLSPQGRSATRVRLCRLMPRSTLASRTIRARPGGERASPVAGHAPRGPEAVFRQVHRELLSADQGGRPDMVRPNLRNSQAFAGAGFERYVKRDSANSSFVSARMLPQFRPVP